MTTTFFPPPPYSPAQSDDPLVAINVGTPSSPRLNHFMLELVNPWGGNPDSVGSAAHPEASTFELMRELEQRRIDRDRFRLLLLRERIVAESAPPPSYAPPTPLPSYAPRFSSHDEVDPYRSLGAPSTRRDATAPRPTPAERERERLQRLFARSHNGIASPALQIQIPQQPRAAPRRLDHATHAQVDPYDLLSERERQELHARELRLAAQARGVMTPQQRERERMERLRAREANRRVARAALSGRSTPTASPHEQVDPYALAERIEALRRRDIVDRRNIVTPQQRELERLERIRSRDEARENSTTMSARIRQACENGSGQFLSLGRVNPV